MEDAHEKTKTELPKRLDRLAAFYACHAGDWQLQAMGIAGYAAFFSSNTPDGCPIESRPMLIECQDSYSVHTSRVMYLQGEKRSRMLGVWDFFHKRHNLKLNAYKRTGLYASIKLQYHVFEVFRGPFKGYAFFQQAVEGMKAYLNTIDVADPSVQDQFTNICHAQGLEPQFVDAGKALSDMREGRWLQVLAPKDDQFSLERIRKGARVLGALPRRSTVRRLLLLACTRDGMSSARISRGH